MKRMGILLLVGVAIAGGCSSSVRTPPSGRLAGDALPLPIASAGDANDSGATDLDAFEKEFGQGPASVEDPLEGWNRMMFQVNDALYFRVFKPVARAYTRVAPQPVRLGVRNFFHNLATPIRFVNCFLQGKGEVAGKEFGRFMVNSTWGILGVADPAKERLGLEIVDDEDLGQTLAVRGVGNGFYIVWPIAGPSTLRDSVGLFGDQFLNPVAYIRPWEAYLGVYVFRATNDYSLHLGEYESLKAAAIEPYSALRDAYVQYRAKSVER